MLKDWVINTGCAIVALICIIAIAKIIIHTYNEQRVMRGKKPVNIKSALRVVKRALHWIFLCKILGIHEWTSKVQRNEPEIMPATKESLIEHMRTYCDICGAESRLNERFKNIFD